MLGVSLRVRWDTSNVGGVTAGQTRHNSSNVGGVIGTTLVVR